MKSAIFTDYDSDMIYSSNSSALPFFEKRFWKMFLRIWVMYDGAHCFSLAISEAGIWILMSIQTSYSKSVSA